MAEIVYETMQFYKSAGQTGVVSTDPRALRTRCKVMQAAWSLLNEVGFDGVTVDRVCERSGVARSTLYRHWRSMPELLRDAFADQASRQPPSTGPVTDGLPALTAYARAFAHGLAHQWGRAAMSLAASAANDPAQRQIQQVFVAGTRRDLRSIIERAVLAGEVTTSHPMEHLVDQLVDQLVAPLFYRYQFTDTAATADVAVDLAERAWAALQST